MEVEGWWWDGNVMLDIATFLVAKEQLGGGGRWLTVVLIVGNRVAILFVTDN